MSCQDDLTSVDLNNNVALSVLERVSAGSGRDENLWGYIDHQKISGLNLENPESARKIVKTWDERHDMEVYCDSGVDDQMIIHIPFLHSLRLRSLLLLAPQPSSSTRPTRIRLYTNLAHMPDFSDLEDGGIQCAQELLTGESAGGWRAGVDGIVGGGGEEGRTGAGLREVEEWPLKVQKMTSVWSVTLMISESEGGDKSRLYYLGFKGESRAPRAGATTQGVVPAANAADAPVDEVAEKKGAGQNFVR